MKLTAYQKHKLDDIIRNMAMLDPYYTIEEQQRFYNDFNFDSLDGIEFIMEVEKQFEISIPDEKIEKVETVKDAYDLLATLL